MRYWIMKSEPSAYGIADLKREVVGRWDGIRNYQVRNMLRDEMRVGDLALFYHSNAAAHTGIAGEMTIASLAYADPLQFDTVSEYYDPTADELNPRWLCVDVRYKREFRTPLLLSILKQDTHFTSMPLLRRGNRLSVLPLEATVYHSLLQKVLQQN